MSFEDEYAAKRRPKSKNSINAFLPVMGLLLAVALGAVAFVLSGPVHELVMDNMSSFPAGTTAQYVVAGALFVILLMVSGLLYAAFIPKPKQKVTEASLKREKEEVEAERLARKKRQKELQRQAARDRERREGR